jgi:hypothetical protein
MYRRYASLFFIVGCDDEVKFVGSAAFLRACLRAGAATQNPPAPLRYLWQIAVPRSRAMKRARVPLLAPTAMPMLILFGGQNELAILEFIHSFVETLDRYFENVCELDVSPRRLRLLPGCSAVLLTTRFRRKLTVAPYADYEKLRGCAFHAG